MMATEIKTPKKLIEVALPLDAINVASSREKSIRHGHPSTLHLWWARRPLAAARAVIFAQMVNDPGYERSLGRGINRENAQKERERLFGIIEKLVRWENTNNADVLEEAREEIWKSWRETCALNKDHEELRSLFDPKRLPTFHDPFAGGGAIPLEAQRLGLEAYASDLNPVAVTINKAMIEIPARFSGVRPVGPAEPSETQEALISDWSGASGIAEDVRRYGKWIQGEATNRLEQNYPQVVISRDMAKGRPDLKDLVGQKLNVVAWLWARTVKSPSPAFSHIPVPLASTFVVSSKKGKQFYVEPRVQSDSYDFLIKAGDPPQTAIDGTKLARGANFRCIMSGMPIDPKYIKAQGIAGALGTKLMAIVAQAKGSRVYLPPTQDQEAAARQVQPGWFPETPIPDDKRSMFTTLYGLTRFGDLFTSRQLCALNTMSELVQSAITKCQRDAVCVLGDQDKRGLDDGGQGALAYSQALGIYLAFALNKMADRGSSICTWFTERDSTRNTFGRQAIPMTWDFAELNVLLSGTGSYLGAITWTAESIEGVVIPRSIPGHALQADARTQAYSANCVISTDPPYYDNIGYADLSEFFYVWLRKTLKPVFPDLFTTETVPKSEELVANPYRHGGKLEAEQFFLSGMTDAMKNLAGQAHPVFPVTIYYAFKQTETKQDGGTSSTGWETFLEAVLSAGFSITGTWPMRTELSNRMIGSGTNALASSVVLVCRRRPAKSVSTSRREFIRELNAALPIALEEMTSGGVHSPVAPVDLSQAIIGPGMAIFSKYSAVLEADGKPMSVRTALQLINRFLANDDFDPDTQFCIQWFELQGWEKGKFGDAESLSKVKGISVQGLHEGGVIASGGGAVRLLRTGELRTDWEPEVGRRISVWELLHHMIRRFLNEGEAGAAGVLVKSSGYAESIRTLAYRLYTLCERKGWAQDAGSYNSLIIAWEAIEAAAQSAGYAGVQVSLFGSEPAVDAKENKPKGRVRKKI